MSTTTLTPEAVRAELVKAHGITPEERISLDLLAANALDISVSNKAACSRSSSCNTEAFGRPLTGRCHG